MWSQWMNRNRAEFHIFIDRKHDGVLVDAVESTQAWKQDANTYYYYGIKGCVLRASYGTGDKETSSSDYTLNFYLRTDRPQLLEMYPSSARKGTVTIAGKPVNALLTENNGDALFNKALGDDGKPGPGQVSGQPVSLWLQGDDGKTYSQLNISVPFKFGADTYAADVSPDGATVAFAKTTRKAADPGAGKSASLPRARLPRTLTPSE